MRLSIFRIPMSSIAFRYETAASGGYVPILGDSAVVSGPIASQDAGSSYSGRDYYQVGGGTLNGMFAAALGTAGQLGTVNTALQAAYDARFGAGAWDHDKTAKAAPGGDPPLTSFLVPLTPGVAPIGSSVVGLMYSVGPQLGSGATLDPTAYAQIYTDAMSEVARFRAAGHALDGLRLTMLSAGAYAPGGVDLPTFYAQVAGLILDGIVAGAKADPSLADLTLLVNANDNSRKERMAFDAAAVERGITPNTAGFDVPLT